MYWEDQKEGEGGDAAASDPNESRRPTGNEDRKPTQDQLMMRTDSECLSSIINTTPSNNNGFARDEMGAMQFDFSSYGHPSAPGIGGGGGGGVSLTLGLQQHGGGGVTLAFTPPPPPPQFYGGRDGGDGMEDCHAVEYSMFDGENQNLQYRNLMGAQLLRDLGG